MKIALIITGVIFVALLLLKLALESYKKKWQISNPDRVAEVKKDIGDKYTALPNGYTRNWNIINGLQWLNILLAIIFGLIWWLA